MRVVLSMIRECNRVVCVIAARLTGLMLKTWRPMEPHGALGPAKRSPYSRFQPVLSRSTRASKMEKFLTDSIRAWSSLTNQDLLFWPVVILLKFTVFIHNIHFLTRFLWLLPFLVGLFTYIYTY